MGATVVQVDQRLPGLGRRLGGIDGGHHLRGPRCQPLAQGLQLRAGHALGLRQRQQAGDHIGPVGPQQRIQVAEPELRPPRIGIQSRFEMRQRLLRPAQADGVEHAEVVLRIRMRWITRQHRPIQRLGFLERKAAVLLNGLPQ
jgi:hypothetical protein